MNGPDKQFTKFLVENISPFEEGFFIECGANDGIAGSPCFKLEQNHKWTGINIEANPYCFKKLKEHRPHCINIRAALSNNDDVMEFTLPIDGPRGKFAGQASIVYKPGHWKRGNKKRPTETFKVKCLTYDSMISSLNIKNVDLFVLDVEGAEELVLEKMTSVMPNFLCVEDNYKGNEGLYDIIKDKGYEFIARYKNNSLWGLN